MEIEITMISHLLIEHNIIYSCNMSSMLFEISLIYLKKLNGAPLSGILGQNILICYFFWFYESIKCFKLLYLNRFQISENVISMIVWGGCLDLFHLCQGQKVLRKIVMFY